MDVLVIGADIFGLSWMECLPTADISSLSWMSWFLPPRIRFGVDGFRHHRRYFRIFVDELDRPVFRLLVALTKPIWVIDGALMGKAIYEGVHGACIFCSYALRCFWFICFCCFFVQGRLSHCRMSGCWMSNCRIALRMGGELDQAGHKSPT